MRNNLSAGSEEALLIGEETSKSASKGESIVLFALYFLLLTCLQPDFLLREREIKLILSEKKPDLLHVTACFFTFC